MSNSERLSQLPTPAHIQEDSMLARRFGKETVNYFGGTYEYAQLSPCSETKPQELIY